MKRFRVEEIDGVLYIDGIDIMKTIGEISKEADRLKAENQKQKEVNEKAIKYVNNHINQETFDGYMDSYELKKLLHILKEASK